MNETPNAKVIELVWWLGVLREEARQKAERDGEQAKDRGRLKPGEPCPIVWIHFTREPPHVGRAALGSDLTNGIER